MLSWDEPIARPNTPSPNAGSMARPEARIATHEVAASRPAATAAAQARAADAPSLDGERVRVEDKRVINGSSDVNTARRRAAYWSGTTKAAASRLPRWRHFGALRARRG